MDVGETIRLALKNNREAQRALVDKYAYYIHAIALRYARNRQDAQDIVQDTFIRIFQNLHQYNHNLGEFKSWIATITVRVALNKYKNFYNSRELPTEEWTKEPEMEPAVYTSLRMEQLLEIISLLPDKYRTIFNLYCIDGYSHKEISRDLGIPEGTSRAILSRAKIKLRKILVEKYAFDYKQYTDGSI